MRRVLLCGGCADGRIMVVHEAMCYITVPYRPSLSELGPPHLEDDWYRTPYHAETYRVQMITMFGHDVTVGVRHDDEWMIQRTIAKALLKEDVFEAFFREPDVDVDPTSPHP